MYGIFAIIAAAEITARAMCWSLLMSVDIADQMDAKPIVTIGPIASVATTNRRGVFLASTMAIIVAIVQTNSEGRSPKHKRPYVQNVEP